MNEILNFWDNNHINDNVSVLSGVKYDETINFLKIEKYIIKDKKVLEIGVGLGYVTMGLFGNGLEVSAMDISNIALDRVQKYCHCTYNMDNLHELPSNYFDIIICNNVVQHIPTSILIDELKEFMRSLKIGGVFAVEFVSSSLFDDNGLNPTIDDIKAGRLCRSSKYLEQIFNIFDGKCILVFNEEINIGILKGHHIFHVRK